MSASSLTLRQWVKARQNPLADAIYRVAMGVRHFSLPLPRGVGRALYALHVGVAGATATAARVLWWTPLFQSRLTAPAEALFLYGGMPLVIGNPEIRIGRNCRVSGQTTITGRTAGTTVPQLFVGDNCDIGWQTTIAVGRRISLGNNVRIAGRAFLAGYPGHPLNPEARGKGLPDTEDQIGDIILEDDVWLATGVTVSAGVRIGRGSVIAAGSVVTRDIPPSVLAGGVPARVIRTIEE